MKTTTNNPEKPLDDSPVEAAKLPTHNRKKAAVFTFLVLISIFVNTACGVLTYAIYSRGEILSELYDYLASHDLPFFMWAAAGVGLLGCLFSLAAYALSFDYRRPGRPVVRLWILLSSFGVFIAGLLLGVMDVSADNVPVVLGVGFLCLLVPLPIFFIERAVGRGALNGAERLLGTNALKSARTSARTALVFLPGTPAARVVYGRALSASGQHLEALPYLVFAEKQQEDMNAETALALANAWDAAGDPQKTILYLEQHRALDTSPETADRLVRLWLDHGEPEKALDAMLNMSVQERKPWRDELLALLTERRHREEMHRLCREIRADDEPPFEQSVFCYKSILSAFPSDVQALDELVDVQKELKQHETVAALQEELLHLEENRTEVRRELINYYWERGQRENLLRHLNRLLLSGQATTAEKIRILEETFEEGDYLRVEQLLEQEPDLANNPRALFVLATTLAEAGREEEALERIGQARRLGPEDARLGRNLDALAANLRKLQLNKGLSTLEERVHAAPEDLDTKFDYIDHLVAARSADRAVVQLDDMLQKQPELQERVEKEIRVMLSRHGKNRRLMEFLGDLYLRNRQFDKAFELYERRAQDELDAADIMHEAAQKILALEPQHLPSLKGEARYHFNNGNPAEALAYIDRLHGEDREAPEMLRLEMDAAQGAGEKERAVAAGCRLLELAPQETSLRAPVAQLMAEAGQFDKAIELLQQASEADPESFELRRQLRTTVETMRRKRMEEIRVELESRPRDRDLLEEMGDIHHDFEQLNEAITFYQRAGMNDAARRIPKAKLGYLLARKGLFTEADEALQDADLNSNLDEDEQEQLKNLFFTTARLMEEADEPARALNLYRAIFRVDAGYKDVVNHIERLQITAKKKGPDQ